MAPVSTVPGNGPDKDGSQHRAGVLEDAAGDEQHGIQETAAEKIERSRKLNLAAQARYRRKLAVRPFQLIPLPGCSTDSDFHRRFRRILPNNSSPVLGWVLALALRQACSTIRCVFHYAHARQLFRLSGVSLDCRDVTCRTQDFCRSYFSAFFQVCSSLAVGHALPEMYSVRACSYTRMQFKSRLCVSVNCQLPANHLRYIGGACSPMSIIQYRSHAFYASPRPGGKQLTVYGRKHIP